MPLLESILFQTVSKCSQTVSFATRTKSDYSEILVFPEQARENADAIHSSCVCGFSESFSLFSKLHPGISGEG
jgi:hypothetical protein